MSKNLRVTHRSKMSKILKSEVKKLQNKVECVLAPQDDIEKVTCHYFKSKIKKYVAFLLGAA